MLASIVKKNMEDKPYEKAMKRHQSKLQWQKIAQQQFGGHGCFERDIWWVQESRWQRRVTGHYIKQSPTTSVSLRQTGTDPPTVSIWWTTLKNILNNDRLKREIGFFRWFTTIAFGLGRLNIFYIAGIDGDFRQGILLHQPALFAKCRFGWLDKNDHTD